MNTNGEYSTSPLRAPVIYGGSILHEVQPLTRASVEQVLRDYFIVDYHAVLFLTWEIKKQPGHPENERVIKEFVDILVDIGLVE